MFERGETVERLREALISLERSRRREQELRAVEASMVDVVRVLSVAVEPRETFASLLDVLRDAVPFQEAAILVRADGGAFCPAARTCQWMSALRLEPRRMLSRVADGEIAVMFDASLVPEWRAQPPEVRHHARSVIHVPLRAGGAPAILVCTHAERARFEQRHVEMVKRLVPLAGQILEKLDLQPPRAGTDQPPPWPAHADEALTGHA
jgi:GAF domain-containing protein